MSIWGTIPDSIFMKIVEIAFKILPRKNNYHHKTFPRKGIPILNQNQILGHSATGYFKLSKKPI